MNDFSNWGKDPNFQIHSFLADVSFFTPWKYQKAFGFLMILGGTTQKWEHWPEMGERNNFNLLSLSLFLSGSLSLCLSVSLSLSPSLSYFPEKLVLIAKKSWLLTHSKHYVILDTSRYCLFDVLEKFICAIIYHKKQQRSSQ